MQNPGWCSESDYLLIWEARLLSISRIKSQQWHKKPSLVDDGWFGCNVTRASKRHVSCLRYHVSQRRKSLLKWAWLQSPACNTQLGGCFKPNWRMSAKNNLRCSKWHRLGESVVHGLGLTLLHLFAHGLKKYKVPVLLKKTLCIDNMNSFTCLLFSALKCFG